MQKYKKNKNIEKKMYLCNVIPKEGKAKSIVNQRARAILHNSSDPKAQHLMDKRIGTITILLTDRAQSAAVNPIISDFAEIVLCRQGLPFQQRSVAVISLIVEGNVDKINALTGRIGRLEGVECKATLTKTAC